MSIYLLSKYNMLVFFILFDINGVIIDIIDIIDIGNRGQIYKGV